MGIPDELLQPIPPGERAEYERDLVATNAHLDQLLAIVRPAVGSSVEAEALRVFVDGVGPQIAAGDITPAMLVSTLWTAMRRIVLMESPERLENIDWTEMSDRSADRQSESDTEDKEG